MKPPWYYRFGLTNWLMAKPWQWHMRTIYRDARAGSPERWVGRSFHQPPRGRLRSAWIALSFPHVHHESEDSHGR